MHISSMQNNNLPSINNLTSDSSFLITLFLPPQQQENMLYALSEVQHDKKTASKIMLHGMTLRLLIMIRR
jgi:hypothetical protein